MSRGGFYYDPGTSTNPLPKEQYDQLLITRGVYELLLDVESTQRPTSALQISVNNQPVLQNATGNPAREDLFKQYWVIHTDPNVADHPGWSQSNTITIRQIEEGLYLTLESNGTVSLKAPQEAGSEGSPDLAGARQHFFFMKAPEGGNDSVLICHSRAGSNDTYYIGGDSKNPTKLIAVKGLKSGMERFIWERKKISISPNELDYYLKQIAAQFNEPSFPRHFHSLAVDVEYIPIRKATALDIYTKDKKLYNNLQWRPEIYDCDDFAVGFKNAVAKWGAKKFKADGFSILVGLIFGRKQGNGHVFNWFITWDKAGKPIIKFLEPQSGTIKDFPFNYNLEYGYY